MSKIEIKEILDYIDKNSWINDYGEELLYADDLIDWLKEKQREIGLND